MRQLLSQNSKMRKSSQNGIHVYNFTLPALKTCPNAGKCAIDCYARQGAYIWSMVKAKHEWNLEMTKKDNFTLMMTQELDNKLKRLKLGHKLIIRIHDSGDFYSIDYFNKWNEIFLLFQFHSNIQFYAYTKQVKMFQSLTLPINFQTIFSYGGKQDALIRDKDRHALVFENETDLAKADYIDASQDDMVALNKDNHKIGLTYHGVKNQSEKGFKTVRKAS
jgi:hypothetical protein